MQIAKHWGASEAKKSRVIFGDPDEPGPSLSAAVRLIRAVTPPGRYGGAFHLIRIFITPVRRLTVRCRSADPCHHRQTML